MEIPANQHLANVSSEPPLISVVVPVYNSEGTIGKFLESLVKSDYAALESIFVDDGSTDSSADIIARHGFRLMHNEIRVGQSISRNRGAAAARGEFICFFDSDVILKPDTISALYHSLVAGECDAVSGNYDPEPADRNFFSEYYACLKSAGHGDTVVHGHAILGTYCSIIRKSYFSEAGGFKSFPPGIDIECEDIGRRLEKIGCRFVFNPSIRVAHHFGGFKKQLYVFTKRTYWFVRYHLRFGNSGDKLAMRGRKFMASVMLFGLSAVMVLLFVIGFLDAYAFLGPKPAFLISGIIFLGAGIYFINNFFLQCFRRFGAVFTVKSVAASILFFTLADIAVFAGLCVHLYKSLFRREDILMKERES